MLRQGRQNVVQQARALGVDHGPHGSGNQGELVVRRPAFDGEIGHACGLLPFQPPYALAEELIQVAGGDGQKLEPLQEWRPVIEGLIEDAPVEVEPGQLPVVDCFGSAQFIQRESIDFEVRLISPLGRHDDRFPRGQCFRLARCLSVRVRRVAGEAPVRKARRERTACRTICRRGPLLGYAGAAPLARPRWCSLLLTHVVLRSASQSARTASSSWEAVSLC